MLPPKVYNDAQKPGKLWKFSTTIFPLQIFVTSEAPWNMDRKIIVQLYIK